jgi:uncharacterized protein (DUF697 family)
MIETKNKPPIVESTPLPPQKDGPAAQAQPEAAPLHELPPTKGADAIIRKWTAWSAGFGLIPIPFIDYATTTGFSLKMLHSLAKYYNVEFRTQLGKSAITALLGSSPVLALGALTAVKAVPIVGLPLAVATGPLVAGGITYAIGRVFTAHFGSGGTLFDFDPEKFRDYFQEQIEAGKEIVKQRKGSPLAS